MCRCRANCAARLPVRQSFQWPRENLLPFNIGMRLPTITKAGVGGLRIAMTRNLGAFVGRSVPVVGTVMPATDAAIVMWNTMQAYNGIVKPEDRVL